MNRKNEKVRGYQWSSASAFQKSREFLNVNLDDCAPLSAPVIVPDPEDVLFPDDRARKRRRVESLVQGFLHGSPLRITSARPSPTSLKLTVEQDKRRVHGKPYKLRPAQKPAKAELTLDDMKVLKPISVEQKSKEATLDLGNDSKNLLHMDQHPSIFGQMSRNKSYSPVNKNSAAVVGKNFCTDISNQAGSASPSHIEHLKLSRLVDGGDQRGGSPSNAKVDPLLPIRHQPFLLPTSDSPNVVPSEHQNRQPVFPQNLNHQTEPSNLSKSAIISQAAYPPSRSVAQQSNGTHSSGPYTFIPPDNGEVSPFVFRRRLPNARTILSKSRPHTVDTHSNHSTLFAQHQNIDMQNPDVVRPPAPGNSPNVSPTARTQVVSSQSPVQRPTTTPHVGAQVAQGIYPFVSTSPLQTASQHATAHPNGYRSDSLMQNPYSMRVPVIYPPTTYQAMQPGMAQPRQFMTHQPRQSVTHRVNRPPNYQPIQPNGHPMMRQLQSITIYQLSQHPPRPSSQASGINGHSSPVMANSPVGDAQRRQSPHMLPTHVVHAQQTSSPNINPIEARHIPHSNTTSAQSARSPFTTDTCLPANTLHSPTTSVPLQSQASPPVGHPRPNPYSSSHDGSRSKLSHVPLPGSQTPASHPTATGMLPRNGVTRIGSEITAQGAPSTYRGSISNQELVGAATVATQWPGTQTALAQAQIDMFPSPSPAKGLPTYSQPLQTQASTPGPQRMSSTSMTPQPVFPSTQAVMNNLWTPWSGNRNTFVRSPYTANQSSTRSPLVQTRHSTNSPTQHQTSPSPSPQQQQQTQQPAQEPQPQQSARTTLSPAEATTIEVKDDHHNEEDDCVVVSQRSVSRSVAQTSNRDSSVRGRSLPAGGAIVPPTQKDRESVLERELNSGDVQEAIDEVSSFLFGNGMVRLT